MKILPDSDIEYLTCKGINFQEIEEGQQKGVILQDHLLPPQKFDTSKADVLIILPAGYPDFGPDMFYLFPWVKLVEGNAFPNAADHPFNFHDKNWQRWSRHNNDWRPGKDGIWTMLKRIDNALETAST